MKGYFGTLLLLLMLSQPLSAENFRTMLAGKLEVSVDAAETDSFPLSYIDSVLIELGEGARFMRGVELELRLPQSYLNYRGSLGMSIYSSLASIPANGVADIQAEREGFEVLQNKLQTVYHIPLISLHGLRESPYISMPTGIISAESFPLLVRINPVIKGLAPEIESMRFQLRAKPLFTDKGALNLSVKYPEQLPDKDYTISIDEAVQDKDNGEFILSEGEHHLTVISNDYRTESRRFIIERGKVLAMTLELQDTIPMVSFEAPENALVYFNNTLIEDHRAEMTTEPGEYEVRFQVGDYSITKQISIEKGHSYRISLMVDVNIEDIE